MADPVNTNLHYERSQGSIGMGALLASIVWQLQPRKVIEIGVCSGFITEALLRNMPSDSTLICCDKDGSAIDAALAVSNEIPNCPKLIRLYGLSSMMKWGEIIPAETIDLAVIDGGHDYVECSHDLHVMRPLISKHGFIVVHDYAGGQADVKRAVDEFIAQYKYDKIVLRECEGSMAFIVIQL